MLFGTRVARGRRARYGAASSAVGGRFEEIGGQKMIVVEQGRIDQRAAANAAEWQDAIRR